MPLPTNLDDYTKYIVKSDEELLEERVSPTIIQRLHRLRGLYAYWLQFPDKFERDIMQQDMALFQVGRAQAYDDVRLVQIILGNMQQASRNFMRWKINQRPWQPSRRCVCLTTAQIRRMSRIRTTTASRSLVSCLPAILLRLRFPATTMRPHCVRISIR